MAMICARIRLVVAAIAFLIFAAAAAPVAAQQPNSVDPNATPSTSSNCCSNSIASRASAPSRTPSPM